MRPPLHDLAGWGAGFTLYQGRAHVCQPPVLTEPGPTPPPVGALWVCTCGLQWVARQDPTGGTVWRLEPLWSRLRRRYTRRRLHRDEAATLRLRIQVVPGPDGWTDLGAQATYQEIADDLVRRGVDPRDVAAALRLSYVAAEADLTARASIR